MGILFNVEPVAKSHGFRFYVAKMILKFHQMYAPANKNQVYEEWKTLQTLRELVYRLKFKEEDAYRIDSILDRLEKDLTKTKESLSRAKEEAESNLFSELSSDIEKEAQKYSDKDRRLTAVRELLISFKDSRLRDRARILHAFVPSGQFRKNVISDENLEKHLRRLGPLYLGGGLLTAVKTEGSLNISGEDKEVRAVEELEADSKHAILLVGCNKSEALYIDPNQSDELRKVDQAVLFQNVRRRKSDNKIEIVYAACTSRSSESEPVHIARSGVLRYEIS